MEEAYAELDAMVGEGVAELGSGVDEGGAAVRAVLAGEEGVMVRVRHPVGNPKRKV
jgi:hypothetical protein